MQILYNSAAPSPASISALRHGLAKLVQYTRPQWFELGNVESFCLRDTLQSVPIAAPIYVTGLARAGTSIVLETIASCAGVASHRYQDFPLVPIPYAWRKFLHYFASKHSAPQERSHFDGLLVTPQSPEAFEEMLWMYFFPDAYGNKVIRGLDARTHNAAFETFYRNHIKKIMLSENAARYVAKGNYNIGRLGYVHRMFPDVCFVVAVRHPSQHIASLIKQHRMFCDMQRLSPRLLSYMRQAGHFEFGLDRRILAPENAAADIHAAWDKGEDVAGWALYWNSVYGELAALLQHQPELAARILVVNYESLCSDPAMMLGNMVAHTHLAMPLDVQNAWAAKLHAPTYYTADYTKEEQDTIIRITAETAAFFGYKL